MSINNEHVLLAIIFPQEDEYYIKFYHFRGLRIWHEGELRLGEQLLTFSSRGEAVDQAISLGASRVVVSTLSDNSHSLYVRINGCPFNPRTSEHRIHS